jgi:hypothetical protein
VKKEFDELVVDGNNYLTWVIDVKIKLNGTCLDHTIAPEAGKDERTEPDEAEALHFLQHYLHPALKYEYMNEDDPLVLWQSLKDHLNQQKSVVLSGAQQDWITLRFQDCMSLAAYNSALQRNMSRLPVCGQKTTDADMIHLSTCRYC